MANTTGSLDAVKRIPARLQALGASSNFFAKCLGIGSGEMSNLLSTRKRLTGTKTTELCAMLDDLEMVARAFAPAPVSFKDPDLILDIVRRLKSGELMIGKIRTGGTIEIEPSKFNWTF